MKASATAAVLLIAAGTVASSDTTLSIALDLEEGDGITTVSYACADGRVLDVRYVTAGANALALLEIDDADRVFVNVVSGSGARYVSGSYAWSTKGTSGLLENSLGDEAADHCDVKK